MDIFLLFLKGIAIGMVNIIPGVSGGTLAVIFGLYDKFVNAITLNVKKLWENRRFIVPLLLGMACGILIFSKLIEVLYTKFPVQTNYFFTGLIFGSLPMLFTLMIKKPVINTTDENGNEKTEEKKLSAGTIVFIVLFALIGCAIVILFTILQGKFNASEIEMILPKITLPLMIRIFIAGILGAIAMIIPGISGSLLMLMMGVYTIVVTAIPALFHPSNFLHALFLLLPNGVGVLIGLVFGAKLISFLLKRFANITYACIFGLIIGSIYPVFPGFSGLKNVWHLIICLICLAAGFVLAFGSSLADKKTEKKVEGK